MRMRLEDFEFDSNLKILLEYALEKELVSVLTLNELLFLKSIHAELIDITYSLYLNVTNKVRERLHYGKD